MERWQRVVGLAVIGLMVLSVGQAAAQGAFRFQVVFSSNRDTAGNWQLYAMNIDGSNVRRLLQSAGNDYGVVLSPDGERLAFTRRLSGGRTEVHGLTVGEQSSFKLADGSNPTWSSDGLLIAYTSTVEDNAEVYLMNPNGFDQRPLTDNPNRDFAPAWSPNGDWIVFKSNRDGEMALWIVRPNKRDLQKLTLTSGDSHPPAWSPSGRQIVHSREVDGRRAIHVFDIEANESRRLSNGNSDDFAPRYTPTGEFIVFTSVVRFQPDIYVMSANGTERTRITDDPGWDWMPTIVRGVTLP